jgi:hypothetical protein
MKQKADSIQLQEQIHVLPIFSDKYCEASVALLEE